MKQLEPPSEIEEQLRRVRVPSFLEIEASNSPSWKLISD